MNGTPEQFMNRLKTKNQLLSNMKVIYSQPKLTVDLLGTSHNNNNNNNSNTLQSSDLIIIQENHQQQEEQIIETIPSQNSKWKPLYQTISQQSRGRQYLTLASSQNQ